MGETPLSSRFVDQVKGEEKGEVKKREGVGRDEEKG